MRNSLKTILAVVSAISLGSLSARADIFNEIGDAGPNLPSANLTTQGGIPAGNSLTAINGTLSSATDVDVFAIRITSTSLFSATTVGGTSMDTMLSLFGPGGQAIYANDDSAGTLQSTLPGGSSFLLGPGLYYIAISLSGNEAVNSANQLLFAQSADPTAVRGPAAGVNPASLTGFNGGTSFPESGAYTITLTGVTAIPEPSVWALSLLGVGAIGFATYRRRQLA